MRFVREYPLKAVLDTAAAQFSDLEITKDVKTFQEIVNNPIVGSEHIAEIIEVAKLFAELALKQNAPDRDALELNAKRAALARLIGYLAIEAGQDKKIAEILDTVRLDIGGDELPSLLLSADAASILLNVDGDVPAWYRREEWGLYVRLSRASDQWLIDEEEVTDKLVVTGNDLRLIAFPDGSQQQRSSNI